MPPSIEELHLPTPQDLLDTQQGLPPNAGKQLAFSEECYIADSPNRGRGCFVKHGVKAGQTIIVETPTIIGPKQTSPLVCVDCFRKLVEEEHNVAGNVHPCTKCGLPLCQICSQKPSDDLQFHLEECALLSSSEQYSKKPILCIQDAKIIYTFLTPLRLLLLSDKDPSMLQMDSKQEDRAHTMLFCFNAMQVVKPLHKLLGLKSRYSAEQIQTACGILDTNCYEVSLNSGLARGLFKTISYFNHDCAPNCRKFFDSQRRMSVVAATDIEAGQELFLSYIPPLLSTPMRQAILQQTKCFTCVCARCKDPTELGTSLAALKCKSTDPKCGGSVLPIDPLNMHSDMECTDCKYILKSDMAKTTLDTATKFMWKDYSESEPEKGSGTLEIIENLQRFLAPTNQLIVGLKLKLVDQVLADSSERCLLETTAIQFCRQLLDLARLIAPGHSKLRGVLSKKYHQLTEAGPDPLIFSTDQIDTMFGNDDGYQYEC